MAKRPLNVLVVDDDRAIQRMVADALTQQGFAVTVERDGEWALKAFEAKLFDAVVLDLLLPAVNGYEVARRIRESPKGKTLPIVMISGVYRNELHQKEAIEHYGASAFLEKPFKLAALYDALRAALKDRYPKGPVPPELPAVADAAAPEKLAGPEAKEEVKLVEQASRAPGTATETIRGDFQTTPLPEVLAELRRWKANGALMCRRASVKKIIYLRDGVPQFVKSNLLAECLGRVMVRELLLSEADCAESLKLMKQTKRQQGTVLIEMGVISPNNLAHALNLQQRAKMLELFTWTSGQYQLTQDRDLPSETVNLEMTAGAIIWEGVRRVYDAARLALSLGAVDDQFVHPSADPLYALQDSGLGEEEQQALQAMDGTKTVAALRALELLPPLDLYRLIYAMKCAGVVELKPKVAVDEPAISFQEVAEASRSAPRAIPPPAQPAVPFDPPRPKANRPSAELVEEPAVTQPAGHDEPMQPTQSPSVFVSRALVEVSGAHGVASAEEGLKRERLAAHVAAMRKQDHFEVLGVPTTAAPDAIHKAYLVLAREFHPDKLAGATSAEVRQLTEQIYNRVALAHDTLMDEAERKRYVKDLEAGPPKKEDGENVGKILSAEGRFQRGEELIKKGAWAQAHKEFAEAVQLYGDEGAFHAFLGWSRFQMDPRDPKNAERALQDLKKAIELNPKSDRTYLFAGHIQKAIGRVDLAEQQFEKALQVNPSCNEALQELSILSWAARLGGGKGKR